jgi:hypothetical protein
MVQRRYSVWSIHRQDDIHADRALADGGQRLLRRQRLTNTRLQPQALQPRRRG